MPAMPVVPVVPGPGRPGGRRRRGGGRCRGGGVGPPAVAVAAAPPPGVAPVAPAVAARARLVPRRHQHSVHVRLTLHLQLSQNKIFTYKIVNFYIYYVYNQSPTHLKRLINLADLFI